jgi:homoserine kinase type II
MAAFTTFSFDSLARYLIMYELGELVQFTPITQGIENSNYFIEISDQSISTEYVLTIAEDISFDDMPFFNDLMTQIHHRGLPVPHPLQTLDGMTGTIFCGKPTSLVERLPGHHPTDITPEYCLQIGTALAELHESAKGLKRNRANPYGHTWVNQTLEFVTARLDGPTSALLANIAKQYQQLESASHGEQLPKGIIHGDLFRDNTLFLDGELSGIIDFYHACEDFLVLDIAICLNDWCLDNNVGFFEERRNALLQGYNQIRVLTATEQDMLVMFQRYAALRFYLTRELSGGAKGEPLKNPDEFLDLLKLLSK